MKRRRITEIIVSCMVIGFLFSGCALFDKKSDKSDKEAFAAPTKGLESCKTPEEAGKKMIDSILEGLSTGNYALYSRDFTDKNKKYFDRKVFDQAHEAVKKKLGDYEGIKFIGFWKKGDYYILLWKARFTDIKDDILVQMYVTKDDSSYKIAALKLI